MVTRILRRIACAIHGHDWIVLRVNTDRFLSLCHLDGHAGFDEDCRRCGKKLRDADKSCRDPSRGRMYPR